MDIYDRLDEMINERGTTRRKLAIKAKISPATLNSAFSRRSGLSVETVAALADALDADANYLLNGKTLAQRDADTKGKLNKRHEEAQAAKIFLDGLDKEEKHAVSVLVHNLKKSRGYYEDLAEADAARKAGAKDAEEESPER